MLGREAAIGTSLYWLIHHKVMRNGEWISERPYGCGTEEHAHTEAAKMASMTSPVLGGRHIYQEVSVSGPYVSWREIWWKYK